MDVDNEIIVLCRNCKIYGMCHEPMKGFESTCCIHFKGEVPKGYIKYRSLVTRFYEQRWKYYVGYVYEGKWNKKTWLTDSDLDGK